MYKYPFILFFLLQLWKQVGTSQSCCLYFRRPHTLAVAVSSLQASQWLTTSFKCRVVRLVARHAVPADLIREIELLLDIHCCISSVSSASIYSTVADVLWNLRCSKCHCSFTGDRRWILNEIDNRVEKRLETRFSVYDCSSCFMELPLFVMF